MLSGGVKMLRLRACLADAFMSFCVSWLPHTLHSHTTAAPAKVLAELGFHFFDISLSHWGQVMNDCLLEAYLRA